jgi:hypothetical protein
MVGADEAPGMIIVLEDGNLATIMYIIRRKYRDNKG